MGVRITNLTTATNINSDDYIVIDGTTDGTRKALVTDVGGAKMHDFTSSLTPSIDSRGVTPYVIRIYANADDITMPNVIQTYAYFDHGSSGNYPLIIPRIDLSAGNGYYQVYLKSIFGDPQSTTSTTVTGTLHVVTPFEVSNVVSAM